MLPPFFFEWRCVLQCSVIMLKIKEIINNPEQPENSHPERRLQVFHTDGLSVYLQCPSIP